MEEKLDGQESRHDGVNGVGERRERKLVGFAPLEIFCRCLWQLRIIGECKHNAKNPQTVLLK